MCWFLSYLTTQNSNTLNKDIQGGQWLILKKYFSLRYSLVNIIKNYSNPCPNNDIYRVRSNIHHRNMWWTIMPGGRRKPMSIHTHALLLMWVMELEGCSPPWDSNLRDLHGFTVHGNCDWGPTRTYVLTSNLMFKWKFIPKKFRRH